MAIQYDDDRQPTPCTLGDLELEGLANGDQTNGQENKRFCAGSLSTHWPSWLPKPRSRFSFVHTFPCQLVIWNLCP